MTQDISERRDVIDSHPDIARRLESELETLVTRGRSR